MPHLERHKTHRIGWLRAAVLGANDGIVSTASLVIGVAASGAGPKNILIAGVAGLAAGATAMAAGEYVSVSSQSDIQRADLERERNELATQPEHELEELTDIYVKRGLDAELASQVATQLMAHDALGAHARDELGISEAMTARPIQAAMASAATFASGALMPLLVVLIAPHSVLIGAVAGCSLLFLALLGSLAAAAGGSSVIKAAARVTLWGARKIASIGVGIRRWVTYHGFAINVRTDLSYFDAIVPCGIECCRMTSVDECGRNDVSMPEFSAALAASFARVFNYESSVSLDAQHIWQLIDSTAAESEAQSPR